MTLTFTVLGAPQQKGSTKSFLSAHRSRRTGRRRLVTISDNVNLAAWEQRVAFNAIAARNLAKLGDVPFQGPVALEVGFYLKRPKTVTRLRPTVPPDLDKLLRGCCDALTGVLYPDDAHIVSACIWKRYADDKQTPRAVISIAEAQ